MTTFGIFMAGAFWAAYWVFSLDPRVRPYMDRLLLWCSLIGFAGAFGFAKLENWHYNGLNSYGGLLFGIGTYLVILRKMPILTALDIGSLPMLIAYSIGRLGCHLAGD